MKQFRFTLQALLIVLEQKEQVALVAYAKALADQQKALDQLLDAQRLCEEAFRLGRERAASGAPAVHLAQVQEYVRVMKEFEQLRLEEFQRMERSVDSALAKLLGARQSREAVQKLRQSQRERYNHASRREEQKLLDDLAQHIGVASEPVADEIGG